MNARALPFLGMILAAAITWGSAAEVHAARACAVCVDGTEAVALVPGAPCETVGETMCQDAGGIAPTSFTCPCPMSRHELRCQTTIATGMNRLAAVKLRLSATCHAQELRGRECADPTERFERELAKLDYRIARYCSDLDILRGLATPGSCVAQAGAGEAIPIEIITLNLQSCAPIEILRATDNIARRQFGGGGMCTFECGDGTRICATTATREWCDTRASRRCRGAVNHATFDPASNCPADCPAGYTITCNDD